MRTRRAAATVGAVLLTALLAAAAPALPAAASPAPPSSGAPAADDPGGCPYAVAPGPPVDSSEVPEPGRPTPRPLPVPPLPVGGPAMGACGVVAPAGAPAPPQVGVESYVVADLDTGVVYAARNPHARLRPASLMKTLTGLLVARRLDMAAPVVGTREDADQEGTRVGLGPGGQYTVGQLFHAMLMASGNDAAHALAVRLTGGVDSTVALMNRTARDVGALDTRAATPSGLDGPGMQTSAYDLASIFRLGMREPAFAEATGTRQITLPGFAGKPPLVVNNDNKLLANYDGAIGGKTGFTDDARHTYIGAAQRGGHRLVAVLMRGEQHPVLMYEQAIALLDYGFARAGGPGVGVLTARGPDARPGDDGGSGADDGYATLAGPGGDGGGSSWAVPLSIAAFGALLLLVLGVRLRDRR